MEQYFIFLHQQLKLLKSRLNFIGTYLDNIEPFLLKIKFMQLYSYVSEKPFLKIDLLCILFSVYLDRLVFPQPTA